MANGRTGTTGSRTARNKTTENRTTRAQTVRTVRKTRRGNSDGHALDLYTFQPYDAIERAFATDGVYQATKLDAYRDGCLNDDEGDVFANAYRWLIGEMLHAGIMPHPPASACGRANATGGAGTGDKTTCRAGGAVNAGETMVGDADGIGGTGGDAAMTGIGGAAIANDATGSNDAAGLGNAGTATMRTVADIDAAGITPVWAWARWTDDHDRPRSRPDRRCYAFRATGDLKAHLIHLRIPASRVMLSDFDDWHCVLNRAPAMPPESRDWDEARVDRWLDEHWEDPIEAKRRQWRENVLIPTGHEPMGIMDDAPDGASNHVSDDTEDRAGGDTSDCASDCASDCTSPAGGTARDGLRDGRAMTRGSGARDGRSQRASGPRGNVKRDNGQRTIDSTADLMALPNFWVQATFWWIEPADIVRVWQPPRPR